MEKTNSEKAIEKIEFLIDGLINYSENNKYDFALYNELATKSSMAFKLYFSEIDDQEIKDKIISDLKEDFQFKVNDVVIKMMAKPNEKIENFETGETYQISQPSQDNRVKGYEWNYKKLIELFIISIQLETKEPQQKENSEPDEVKKEQHNNIFKGNAFELWEHYKKNKNITGSSATDLRLIFELMKADGLLVDTVELKHYIFWLNKWYFDGAIITLKKITLTTRPNTQRTNDYKEYKETTLKQP